MRIETVPWDSLRPNPENPRMGDVDAIVESIHKNGIYRPIIVAKDGTILAGHHLWQALGQLRYLHVDIVRLDIDPGSDHARRIMLGDNRIADLGSYDEGLLADLLGHLAASDDELYGTGYVADDVTRLLGQVEKDIEDPLDLDVCECCGRKKK